MAKPLTNTTRTTPAGQEYTADANGFPVIPCTRCGGTGNIPGYGNVCGGTCFKCEGRRVISPRGRAGELREQFYTDLATMRQADPAVRVRIANDGTRTHTPGAGPGDVIRKHADEPWRTVAAITPTRRIFGEAYIGHPPRTVSVTLETWITFTNGDRIADHGQRWQRRPNQTALIDYRDDLAAQARAAYETNLDRPAARRTRAHA